MLVFIILQNDGLLCAHMLSLLRPTYVFFVIFSYTHQHSIYAVFCACTNKTLLHPVRLMCQRLLIMRFLQDGKLQGH